MPVAFCCRFTTCTASTVSMSYTVGGPPIVKLSWHCLQRNKCHGLRHCHSHVSHDGNPQVINPHCSWQAQVELYSHDGQLLFICSSDSIQQGSEAVAEMFVQGFCVCVRIVFAECEVMYKITVTATMLHLRFASCRALDGMCVRYGYMECLEGLAACSLYCLNTYT